MSDKEFTNFVIELLSRQGIPDSNIVGKLRSVMWEMFSKRVSALEAEVSYLKSRHGL